jgi:hypothetical protein
LAIDDLAEGLFEAIGRSLKFLIWYVLAQIIIFNIGRFSLLLITLGRYPKLAVLERDANKIVFAGFVVILIAWFSIAFYNQVINA